MRNIRNSILTGLAVCLIGFLDWTTGTEIFFSLFYVLPLSWLALQKDTSWLVLILNSIFAATVWIIAGLILPQEYSNLFVLNWDAIFGLSSFIFIPFLLFFLQKRQREQLIINNTIKNYKDQFEKQKIALNEKNSRLNELNQELEILASVASKTDNAVIIMNNEANVEWVNESFERIYNIGLNEFHEKYGGNFFDFVSESDSMNSIINQCINTRQTVIFETSRTSAGDKKLYYQTTLSPIINADGNVEKLIGVITDISKLKQAEINLLEQNKIINNKNQQITESIYYAENIQKAILPCLAQLQDFFNDVFIFFKPRDIVSGDFYWFHETKEKVFLAAVDGAGHGVPGALMSIVGNSILNEIIIVNKIYSTGEVLEELNKKLISTFPLNREQDVPDNNEMDISLCCFDKTNKTITISSTRQKVYIIKNHQMEIIEGDNFSIGSMRRKKGDEPFKETLVEIDQPLQLFISTDGFQNQLGGNDRIKYNQPRFEEFLYAIHNNNFGHQFNSLHTEFTQWKGESPQTDDVLLIGVYLEP